MTLIKKIGFAFTPLVLGLAFCGNISAAENYYRWKDSGGVTHYGSTPPAGVVAEKIKTHSAPRTEAKEVVDDSTKFENTKKQLSAERKKTCDQERNRLQTLKSSGASIRMKDENGESKLLTPEEIAKEIQASESFLQQACS